MRFFNTIKICSACDTWLDEHDSENECLRCGDTEQELVLAICTYLLIAANVELRVGRMRIHRDDCDVHIRSRFPIVF